MKSSCILALAFVAVTASPARAATHTWSGAVDDNWSKPGNWVEGVAPALGEPNLVLVFPPAGANKATKNDVASLVVESIAISDTAYGLSGQAFTLTSGLTLSGGTPAVNVTIGNDIVLGGNVQLSIESGRFLRLDGALSGPFGFQLSSVGGQTAQLILEQPGTFAGRAVALSGYLLVKDQNALGMADGTAATATAIGPNASIGLYAAISGERLELSGGGANGNGTVQAYADATWNGPIVLSTDVVFTALSTPLSIGGAISGGFGIAFRATAGVNLSGTNTYTGPSRFDYGAVTVTGTQPASSWSSSCLPGCGGTLRGTGTVGAVSMGGATGESVAPGLQAGTTGVLSTGSLSLASPATLAIDIRGTAPGPVNGHDQVIVSGGVNVGGATLQVALGGGFAPAAGQTFALVANDGSDLPIGTFQGLAPGATLQVGGHDLQISYTGGDGNDVVLRALGGGSPAQPPGFAPAADLVRAKGAAAAPGLLGTVSDPDTPLGSLQVSVLSSFTGAQVGGLSVDGAGNVTADVGVDCASSVASGGITVLVTDGFLGQTGVSTVQVQSDGPPSVTPPAAVTVDQTACVGGQPGTTLARLQTRYPSQHALLDAFVNGGSATDVCTPSPTRLAAQLAGSGITSSTLFPVGTSQVSFRFQDGAGEIGTATAGVTVRRQGDVNLDGLVDVFDLVATASLIVGNVVAGSAPYLAPQQVGDADADGDVDIFDLVLVAAFIVGNSTCLTP